jgi:hypothetical protein
MHTSPTHSLKPTIPAMEIYKKPSNDYQKFVNRFCQSKTKIENCATKEDALKKANIDYVFMYH